MFRKVLVANRGEIAVRIIRACREMGIATVAVYSEADAEASHVALADEAYLLGPAEPGASYLNISALLAVARRSGAEAVHPGYGFLAENPAFARAVAEAGLVFIGPSPQAMALMGDKAAAKERMQQAGVPVVPGAVVAGADTELARIANGLGYPVLLKAAAGGGGKGMRVVWTPEQLPEVAASARREARSAFGDDRLIVEKFLPRAHHVEVQILADHYGRVVHLYERECSVQRRHQKIIEESPAPSITEETRRALWEVAIRVARVVGYTNAGTVEFIVDPETQAFYFLEMNTRLQVEHPVTELRLGLDLVQWQLRIAAGERLPKDMETLSARGHAIEARIYAEDPGANFLPVSGTLGLVREPRHPWVRVDSGVRSGSQVPPYYDPLLAKIIAYGEDRETARRRLLAALQEAVYLGLPTNQAFLLDLLRHPDFIQGRVHTRWVEEVFLPQWRPEAPPQWALAAVAWWLGQQGKTASPSASPVTPAQVGPWFRLQGWYPRDGGNRT